jgi:adenylosuccinate lyase
MLRNLNITKGLVFSQKILLALVDKGLKRQQAYEMVQKSAMETWNEGIAFKETLFANRELMEHFTVAEIEKLFSFDEIYSKLDYIFERCGIV